MLNTHARSFKVWEPTSTEFEDEAWIHWLAVGGEEWAEHVEDSDKSMIGS